MNTLLFAPCIIDTPERLQRNIKWLNYYEPLLSKLEVKDIWLIDNASPLEELKKLGGTIYDAKFKVLHSPDLSKNESMRPYLHIMRYEDRLERIRFKTYKYWWRALFTGWQYLPDKFGYDKIIHIDTDMYVLSEKLTTYLREINSGFFSFWCTRHNFAESTFHVLCKDSFDIVDNFIGGSFPIEKYDDRDAEEIIPFARIEKGFVGDRYGELNLPQTPEMDYYGQAGNHAELKYEKS